MGLSAIIPTLNEEKHIETAIKSVLFADEIIVIDSFSTDKTLDIAQKYPVKIIQRPFDNFSNQRNYALDCAINDWVLFLDADEQITEILQKEIIETLKTNTKYKAFECKLDYYFLNRFMQFGGFQTKNVIRLFNKHFCKYDGKLVHETLYMKGVLGKLKHTIIHKNFNDLEHFIDKQRFYAKLKAKQLIDNKNTVNKRLKYLKVGFRFFMHYIVRLGFLDGKAGYVFAKIQAQGVSMRYQYLESFQKMIPDINACVKQLNHSGSILYPTDTVWGIGCDATDNHAVKKIFNLKQRRESKSMVILVDSLAMLNNIIDDIPQKAFELMAQKEIPTTIIYNNPKGLASNVVAEDHTVAIRLVNDDFCQMLIKQFGKPIVSTSANISGESTSKNFAEVSDNIKKNVDYIVKWRQNDNTEKKASRIVKINTDGTLTYLR